MKETTRAYNNQWILQSKNNLDRVNFNMERIEKKVLSKGEYPEIILVLAHIQTAVYVAIEQLQKLQSLFNDPRANKIDVIAEVNITTMLENTRL